MLHLTLLAQAAASPSLGDALLGFLTPGGVGAGLAVVLSLVGGLAFVTQRRKKLVALAAYHAFHIVEDIGNELEGEDGFDKTARYLAELDKYMVANGWRPLKPGEVEVAKMLASAQHGAEVAKAKVLAGAIGLGAADAVVAATAAAAVPK